jgi:ribonuclease HI
MNYITIFADASFDDRTGAAGIAVWARTSDKFHKMSKALTFTLATSGEAETFALGIGILEALVHLPHAPGDALSVQSDCEHALRCLILLQCSTEIESALADHVRDAVYHAQMSMVPKHVKGHTGKSDARSWVNNWCDRAARAKMRIARNRIQKELEAQ